MLGLFDLKYESFADWVFNMRCFGSRRIAISYIPITVSVFEEGGLSGKGDLAFDTERRALIERHMGWSTLFRLDWPETKARARLRLRRYIPSAILKARRSFNHHFRRK